MCSHFFTALSLIRTKLVRIRNTGFGILYILTSSAPGLDLGLCLALLTLTVGMLLSPQSLLLFLYDKVDN